MRFWSAKRRTVDTLKRATAHWRWKEAGGFLAVVVVVVVVVGLAVAGIPSGGR
jgi:hypothetical protein